ncbi:MFS transporter [Deinococcus koreensis]|uniref:MFS transporter n=1 Tax=Deinococcus koreensis TaxID=2054903 RepID=A0A2K3UT32_9DEIO|nr:MFS transporter [Deinococcus koreensis]PNY79670.1 hypothetical protein CVO96_17040 [Deinococcus koreensis]
MSTRFLLFLIAQAVSQFGTAVSTVGLTTLWASRGAPATQLALILALPAIPSLLLAPFVGATVERVALRPFLIGANIFLGAVACAVAWAVAPSGGQAEPTLLVAMFTLKEVGNRAFAAGYARAFGALAPATTGRPVMVADFTSQSGAALGAAVGGLIASKGGGEVFVIDAATFVVAGLITLWLPLLGGAPARRGGNQVVRDVKVAVDHVSNNAQIARLFGAYCSMSLTWAAWDIVGGYLFVAAGSAEASGVANSGAQIGKMSIGLWLFSQGLGHSVNKAQISALVLAGTGLVAGGLGMFGPSPYVIVLLVILRSLFGMTGYLGGNGSYTMMVLDAPSELRARMAVLVGAVGTGLVAGGAKVGVGILNDAVGPTLAFILPSMVGMTLGLLLCRAEFRAQQYHHLQAYMVCRVYWARRAGGLGIAAAQGEFLVGISRI